MTIYTVYFTPSSRDLPPEPRQWWSGPSVKVCVHQHSATSITVGALIGTARKLSVKITLILQIGRRNVLQLALDRTLLDTTYGI